MFRTLAGVPARAILLLAAMAIAPAYSSAAGPANARAVGAVVNAKNFVKRVTNPYFPLVPGTDLRYRGVTEGKAAIDEFIVTHERKTIQRVSTTVVRDALFVSGHLAELTSDWYAQDRRGNVWYFGEKTRTLRPNGTIESTEGSWQAGVRGARAGIFLPAKPRVGSKGQQEFLKGHAEQHFEVLSQQAAVNVPYLSTTKALQTEEWTPLEPGVLENKYYVEGIGAVLELAVKGPAERLELIAVQRQ
jgi:hypothetical protein